MLRRFQGLERGEAMGRCWGFTAGGAGSGKLADLSVFRSNLAYALLGPEMIYVPEGIELEVKVPDLPLSAWTICNSSNYFAL
ncbi:MAG: hypothetical protein AB9866_22635 [Syntrophobacteraceae bacterium]